MFNLWHPGRGLFWPQGHFMNKLDRGPQGDATCKISNLYAFKFQRRRFLKFSFFVPMLKLFIPRGGANFDPMDIILTNLVEVHKEMLHNKYQSSTPSSFREEGFQRFRSFLLFVAMATRVMGGIKFFGQFGRASRKEHSFQVSWRLAQWFWRRRCLQKLLTDDGCRTLGNHNSSPLALCAKVSKKSSLYFQSVLIFIHKTPVVKNHPTTREIRELLWPRSTPTGIMVYFYMSSSLRSFTYRKYMEESFKHGIWMRHYGK